MSALNQPQGEPSRRESELTDDDLDSVAGGKRTWTDPVFPDPVIQPVEPVTVPLDSL